MARAGLQPPVEVAEGDQHAAHVHDGIDAVGRPAAVGGAARRHDLTPREALVADGHVEIGRLGDDAGIGTPARHERIGADARVLLVDDAGDDDLSGGQAAALRHDAHGIDHRRDAALHVLGAAAVHPSVAHDRIERRRHAGHADRVDVPAQHQRRARERGRSSVPTTFGRPGATSWTSIVQADAFEFLDHAARHGRLPGRTGHERRVHRIDGHEIAEQTFDGFHDGGIVTGRARGQALFKARPDSSRELHGSRQIQRRE